MSLKNILIQYFTIILVSCLIFVSTIQAQVPGDLIGTHIEDLGGDDTYNSALIKDGKLIAAGTTDVNGNPDTVLAKYQLAVGGLIFDPTFNLGAPIIHDFKPGNNEESNGNWVDVDGIDTDFDGIDDDYEIYVGGTVFAGTTYGGVSKFSSDGVLDPVYALNTGDALLCPESHSPDGFVNDAGEVFMTGNQFSTQSDNDFWTGKLDSTGIPDAAFGTDGCKVEFGVAGNETGMSTMDYDGTVLTAGMTTDSDTDIHMIRYISSGGYDLTFGGGTGKVVTRPDAILLPQTYKLQVKDAAIMKWFNLRRILVVGTGLFNNGLNTELFMVRYFRNGTINPVFGSAGTGAVTTDLGLSNPIAEAVAIDNNLRIIVTGNTITGMWVARFLVNGALDLAFGVGGVVTTAGNERVVDVIIIPNGRDILVVGKDGNGDAFLKLFKG